MAGYLDYIYVSGLEEGKKMERFIVMRTWKSTGKFAGYVGNENDRTYPAVFRLESAQYMVRGAAKSRYNEYNHEIVRVGGRAGAR